MYQEHKCVKYICKCGGSQTSHKNISKKKECICNLNDQLNLTDVRMFDPIVHMVMYHKKNQIQPFSVIYLNDNGQEKEGEAARTISSIVSNMWKNKDSVIEY
tara:strand:- start:354 stop:659 length:306 start_codon:yes stop_codon:yes gene_type:complete